MARSKTEILSKPFLRMKDFCVLFNASYKTIKPVWESMNQAFETETGNRVFRALGVPTSFALTYCHIDPGLLALKEQKKAEK